jgi:hypothetical protein
MPARNTSPSLDESSICRSSASSSRSESPGSRRSGPQRSGRSLQRRTTAFQRQKCPSPCNETGNLRISDETKEDLEIFLRQKAHRAIYKGQKIQSSFDETGIAAIFHEDSGLLFPMESEVLQSETPNGPGQDQSYICQRAQTQEKVVLHGTLLRKSRNHRRMILLKASENDQLDKALMTFCILCTLITSIGIVLLDPRFKEYWWM